MPTTAVALWRGINVGRAKRISMSDLRNVLASLGFENVRTVLQSGNAVFEVPGGVRASTAERIEAAVLAATGVQAAVLVIPAATAGAAAAENPLIAVATDPSRLLITFTEKPPGQVSCSPPDVATLAPEVLVVGEHAIFQWCPDGVAASAVPPAFWRPFGNVTARNARTLEKILAAVGSLP